MALTNNKLADRIKFYYNNYQLNSRQHTYLLVLSLFITFISIYGLNVLQPLFTDDWEYSFVHRLYDCANKGSIPDIRISSLSDIVTSQYEHYFAWGGRSVNHIIAQFLLFIGEPYNKILNSLAYLALTYLIALFVAQKGKRIKLSVFFLANMLIFFFIPVFGSTLLWMTGSANYLWGTLILLLFLLPYKRLYESIEKEKISGQSPIKAFYLLLGGIFAGWTNENMVAASIGLLFFFFVYARYCKWHLPLWFYTGFVGFITGFLFMILAPGNFVRYKVSLAAQGGEELSKISLLTGQFITAISGIFFYLIPIIATFLIMLIFAKYWGEGKSKESKLAIALFITSILAVLVMTFAPDFPERAWFGIIIFIIIAILLLFDSINFKVTFLRTLRTVLFCILGFSFIGYYTSGYKDLSRTKQIFDKRAKFIEEQKKKGTLDFVFDSEIKSKSRINNLYDLSSDPTYWVNCFYARYYDINSVSVIKPECK